MSILVTGGTGYIGSHTVVELLNEGYETVVIDNLCNSSKESLKRVEELTGKTVKFYEADIRDRAALDRIFAENKIDRSIPLGIISYTNHTLEGGHYGWHRKGNMHGPQR